MRVTKTWFLLVALAGAAAAAALFLLRAPAQAAIDAQLAARMAVAERSAGLALKIHARRWIDAAAQAASDAQLGEGLGEATRAADRSSNLDLIHRSVQARLRYFRDEWKSDQVIAVDARGRVIARVGIDEDQWRDDISGYPVVGEALRGYRLDDTWNRWNKLYRVCASPVVSNERYVGALLVAQELGPDLANHLRDVAGVESAFLLDGAVVSQSGALPIFSELPELARARAGELPERGHLEGLNVRAGGRSYLVHLMGLPGEASADGAAYALVVERPVAPSLATLTDGGVSLSTLPANEIGLLAMALLFVLLAGFVAFRLEYDRPLARLIDALQALTREGIDRVDDSQHRGRFATIARAVNTGLLRLRRDLAPISAVPGPLFDGAIPPPLPMGMLSPEDEPAPAAAAPAFPIGASTGHGPAFSGDASGPPGLPLPLPLIEPPNFAESRAPSERAPAREPAPMPIERPPVAAPATLAPVALAAITPVRRAVAPIAKASEPATTPGPTPLPALLPSSPGARPNTATPSSGRGGAQTPAPAPLELMPIERGNSTPLRVFDQASQPVALPPEARRDRPAHGHDDATFIDRPLSGPSNPDFDDPPTMQRNPRGFGAGEIDEGEAGYDEVYREYLETKRRCGEPTAGLTFDKFRSKLRQNRESIQSRFPGKKVRFQVYIKDGKAALKATPITK